jgi:hypothetical protein
LVRYIDPGTKNKGETEMKTVKPAKKGSKLQATKIEQKAPLMARW